MSKGSATEQTLGNLHSKITAVFQRILERYEARLQAIEDIDPDDIQDEIVRELFDEAVMPNPAMLSAVTKFLKDNEISFDTEQLDELGETERRLAERREKRSNVTTLSTLKVVGDNG